MTLLRLTHSSLWLRERIHSLLQDGYIMVTWANHHYLDFAKSWVMHVKKASVCVSSK